MLLPEYMTQADSPSPCPHCGEVYYIERHGEDQERLAFWWCDICEKGFHTVSPKPYTTVKLTTVSQWEKQWVAYLPNEEGNFNRYISVVQQVFNDPLYAVGLLLEAELVYCLGDAPMLAVQNYCSVCQHPLWRNDWYCESCHSKELEGDSE